MTPPRIHNLSSTASCCGRRRHFINYPTRGANMAQHPWREPPLLPSSIRFFGPTFCVCSHVTWSQSVAWALGHSEVILRAPPAISCCCCCCCWSWLIPNSLFNLCLRCCACYTCLCLRERYNRDRGVVRGRWRRRRRGGAGVHLA